jgi:hypothetical protein
VDRLSNTATRPCCSGCSSELIYPVGWERREGERWLVDVRCPQCEDVRELSLERSDVDRLDEEFDTGLRKLVDDLKLLERGNMEDDVERFVAALMADQIHPSDF